MDLRGVQNYWRRKTLRKRLAEATEKELWILREEIRDKVRDWQAVLYLIEQELRARRPRRKGA